MCNKNLEYDATASWSGYTYQGKVAIYITLKKINNLRTLNPNCNTDQYYLELEWLEDFAVLCKNEAGELVYESIHQVKARKDQKLSAYSSALIKLLQKIDADGNIENAFLHTIENIDYQNDWLNELKKVSVDDSEVKKWIDGITTLLTDSNEKSKLVSELPKKRNDFSKQLKKRSSKKITIDNIDEVLIGFKLELEVALDKMCEGFSDETLNKVNLYQYDNGQEYCALDEIDNLIRAEIITYWNNGVGTEWKILDKSFQDIVLRCLTGIIDTHIMNRHKDYGSSDIEKLNFYEFEEILRSDAPIERCREYYLYIIKEKLLNYCDEYERTCYEDCEDENDFSSCTVCQLGDFKRKVLSMTFDEIYELAMCDRLICESVFGGFLMNCPDQDLCREIIIHLAPIQIGEAEPNDFPVATREEVEVFWDDEEEAVMRAEFRLL